MHGHEPSVTDVSNPKKQLHQQFTEPRFLHYCPQKLATYPYPYPDQLSPRCS